MAAVVALTMWRADFEGSEPDGWIRHLNSGRRRKADGQGWGKKETEYVPDDGQTEIHTN